MLRRDIWRRLNGLSIAAAGGLIVLQVGCIQPRPEVASATAGVMTIQPDLNFALENGDRLVIPARRASLFRLEAIGRAKTSGIGAKGC